MSLLRRIRRRYRGPVTPGLAAGVITGVALHAAGLFWLGSTWSFPAPAPAAPAYVTASADSRTGRDYAELLDPSPLFLPTKLNHGTAMTSPPAQTPEESPLPVHPQSEPTPRSALASRPRAQADITVSGVKGAGIADTWAAYRLKSPAAPKPGRPRCEIIEETSNAIVRESDLAGTPRRQGDLPPAEFLLVVDAYGPQAPTLVAGTGDTEADAELSRALAKAAAERPLPPGRYRATLAP